jgi:SAM-dependent methyltransferase
MSPFEHLESGSPVSPVGADDLKRVWRMVLEVKRVAPEAQNVGFDARLISERCEPRANFQAVLFRLALLQCLFQEGFLDEWREGDTLRDSVFQASATFPMELGVQGFDTSAFMARLRSVVANADKSNGYEEIASIFIPGRGRNQSGVGTSVVADWSRTLPDGAAVLDLGCGTGVPISQALIEREFHVHGVDASPSMIAAFRSRFPAVPLECAAVEDSDFFGRTFDGVVAWGLFFLLDADVQRRLIAKVAAALSSGGKLLFTAPSQSSSWPDAMTGRTSISLGFDAYRVALEAEGMSLLRTDHDAGENHYYFAQKT